MSASPSSQAASAQLTVKVARAYYLEDKTKLQIAAELDISRFKVARLLARARETGIVTVSIHENPSAEMTLAARLRHRFGLVDSIVVAPVDHAAARDQVAMAGAAFLATRLSPQDVVGLAWGRTLAAMSGFLGGLPPVRAIQLNGSLGDDLAISPIEILRRVVTSAEGQAVPIFAPLLVDNPEAATTIRRQPEIRRAYEAFHDLTIACLSAGSWEPTTSQLVDRLEESERLALVEAGAVGEVAGIFLDAQGRPLEMLAGRMIRIPVDLLARVPLKIVIADGVPKASIVLAAIRAGLVDAVVVDHALAAELLRLSEPED
ncbi:DNA-binding transcriptional regulator LsrR (DeoR family) [Salana multivorans]|uniref:DNA-binding transcriptional regulator LsrR (DeoR family) n=1 Tax=Salana multivorans TaxID=120377 RepID=A0A3N2DA18_9MICO|nr:sugar-binding domain-containing protein [Salana multivorans]MBN8881140.1 hypothetical protein [Salana multivorans]OJX95477.1 MAG: hypothetical protein BGO96_11750 [Micrococcales bacterium 73-15]ROR96468.1 DNA-binding transcriptional regulator LsrR (DeoR family) [Salana multivorans]